MTSAQNVFPSVSLSLCNLPFMLISDKFSGEEVQPRQEWGSCSAHRRLHVLVSLHHALRPRCCLAFSPMISRTSSGNESMLIILQRSSAIQIAGLQLNWFGYWMADLSSFVLGSCPFRASMMPWHRPRSAAAEGLVLAHVRKSLANWDIYQTWDAVYTGASSKPTIYRSRCNIT